MTAASRSLTAAVRSAFRRLADPARAPAMRAYMKSEMPYFGVPLPAVRSVCKTLFAEHPLASAIEWRNGCLSLWRLAKYREERYAALYLAGMKAYAPFQTLDALPMYEEMIVSGAWWDYVDDIAIHRLGPMLLRYPRQMKKTMLRWSRSRDLWKRRSAIICQAALKGDTDLELLYACIEPALGEREFFLRKAIGWALRSYAWTDPHEVARYVRAHEGRLSPLSKREALKNIDRTAKPRKK